MPMSWRRRIITVMLAGRKMRANDDIHEKPYAQRADQCAHASVGISVAVTVAVAHGCRDRTACDHEHEDHQDDEDERREQHERPVFLPARAAFAVEGLAHRLLEVIPQAEILARVCHVGAMPAGA